MEKEISIVIGSWGSYNECNERALGSKWLNLSDYSGWENIEEELVKQGFEMDGMDEELFIQDIEGLPSNSRNWDYTNPKQLFELLKESEVLEDDYKYEAMCAYLDVRGFDEFYLSKKEAKQAMKDFIERSKVWEKLDAKYKEQHKAKQIAQPNTALKAEPKARNIATKETPTL